MISHCCCCCCCCYHYYYYFRFSFIRLFVWRLHHVRLVC